MPEQLDVYRDWLGITETVRPLNYYQLLRLKPFIDDTAKIRTHYRKMNTHVRKFATGDHAEESQELLNELARALLCLTDVQRKREYDASLGRKEAGEGRRRTLEEILLADKTIDRGQLTKARDYAKAVGLEIRDALVQQKMAAPDVVMLAYAESLGLPYVELEDVGVEEQLIPQVPPTIARQHSCVPVMTDEGQLLMASPNPLIPDVEEELRLRFDMPVRTVLCTPASINALIAKYYPRSAAPPALARKTVVKQEARDERTPVFLTPDERIRLAGMIGMVAFNVTVIVCVLFFVILRGGMHVVRFVDLSVGVLVALVAGGAAFGVIMVFPADTLLAVRGIWATDTTSSPTQRCREARDALILSIVGYFFCSGIVLFPWALVKASAAKKKMRLDRTLRGEGMATGAQLIAWFGLLLLAIALVRLVIIAFVA